MLSESHNKKPISLQEAMEYLNIISGNASNAYGANITVESLHSGYLSDRSHISSYSSMGEEMAALVAASNAPERSSQSIQKIEQEMKRLNAHRFLPLVTCASEANVAIALYAGDGIVMKVTKSSELNNSDMETGAYKPLPGVLPPITRTTIGDYVVEMFPWVNTFDITDKDVNSMKTFLSGHGMAFHEKDAKPNNLGRLMDGTLVVLDGNAVAPVNLSKPPSQEATQQWMDKVHAQFSELYHAPDPAKLISDNPDFSLSFSPLVPRNKPVMAEARSNVELQKINPKDLKPASRGLLSWFSWGKGDRA